MSTQLWPNLGYRDAFAAIRFLVDTFGFEEEAVYASGPNTIGHARLRWPGGGYVTIYSAEKNAIADLPGSAAGGGVYPPFSVHIETAEPDGLYARVVAAGATIVRAIENSPLGTRGFIASDPEGLYWSFGTPLPQLVQDASGHWQPPARP